MKTATISSVNGLSKNSYHNTYPLVFGPKNSSHESIEIFPRRSSKTKLRFLKNVLLQGKKRNI